MKKIVIVLVVLALGLGTWLTIVSLSHDAGRTPNSRLNNPSVGASSASCTSHINGGYAKSAVVPIPGTPGAVYTYKAQVNRVTTDTNCKPSALALDSYPTGRVSFYGLSPTPVSSVKLTWRSNVITAASATAFSGLQVGEAVLGANVVGSVGVNTTTITAINAPVGSTASVVLSSPPNGLSSTNTSVVENLVFQPYFAPGNVNVSVANVTLSGATGTVTPAYPITASNGTDVFSGLKSYNSHWQNIGVSGPGVASGTTVKAVAANGRSITLSTPASSGASVTLTFSPPALCTTTQAPFSPATGASVGTCTVSSSPNLTPVTESDAVNVWDYYAGDAIFASEVDQNFDPSTTVQTYTYTNTAAFDPTANVCGTSGAANCGWNNAWAYSTNLLNNTALQGNLTSNAPVKLVGMVMVSDSLPWGSPQGAVNFQLQAPGVISVGKGGVGSNTPVTLTPSLCVATFIGNDYQDGVSLYGCTVTLGAFTATGPTDSVCQSPTNPAVGASCAGLNATTAALTMAPTSTNPNDPRGYPYHGVFTYDRIIAPFCGLGCGLTGGQVNVSPWASAASGNTQGFLPPAVPSNCATDITTELQTGSGGHWTGSVWDGGGGCYELPQGSEIANSNVTIKNATIYDPQVQNNTNANGTVGSFNAIIGITGGGTGKKDGGWSPGGPSPAWTYVGTTNLTLQDLTLIGADQTGGYVPANVGGAGIKVLSSSGDRMDNIVTQNTWGDSLETFFGGSANNSPPVTNLHVCDDGLATCAYTAYNSGRDQVTINCIQGNGSVSGTVNGVSTVYSPSVLNNMHLLGSTGQGNAFDFESDLAGVGIQYPTSITINNSTWDGLLYFTTYNQGLVTFNNDVGLSGWLQLNGNNSITYASGGPGARFVFNSGKYTYGSSPGVRVTNQASATFNKTGFASVGTNVGWLALTGSSLTFHTGDGSFLPPAPTGTNDDTSTVSIVP